MSAHPLINLARSRYVNHPWPASCEAPGRARAEVGKAQGRPGAGERCKWNPKIWAGQLVIPGRKSTGP